MYPFTVNEYQKTSRVIGHIHTEVWSGLLLIYCHQVKCMGVGKILFNTFCLNVDKKLGVPRSGSDPERSRGSTVELSFDLTLILWELLDMFDKCLIPYLHEVFAHLSFFVYTSPNRVPLMSILHSINQHYGFNDYMFSTLPIFISDFCSDFQRRIPNICACFPNRNLTDQSKSKLKRNGRA